MPKPDQVVCKEAADGVSYAEKFTFTHMKLSRFITTEDTFGLTDFEECFSDETCDAKSISTELTTKASSHNTPEKAPDSGDDKVTSSKGDQRVQQRDRRRKKSSEVPKQEKQKEDESVVTTTSSPPPETSVSRSSREHRNLKERQKRERLPRECNRVAAEVEEKTSNVSSTPRLSAKEDNLSSIACLSREEVRIGSDNCDCDDVIVIGSVVNQSVPKEESAMRELRKDKTDKRECFAEKKCDAQLQEKKKQRDSNSERWTRSLRDSHKQECIPDKTTVPEDALPVVAKSKSHRDVSPSQDKLYEECTKVKENVLPNTVVCSRKVGLVGYRIPKKGRSEQENVSHKSLPKCVTHEDSNNITVVNGDVTPKLSIVPPLPPPPPAPELPRTPERKVHEVEIVNEEINRSPRLIIKLRKDPQLQRWRSDMSPSPPIRLRLPKMFEQHSKQKELSKYSMRSRNVGPQADYTSKYGNSEAS